MNTWFLCTIKYEKVTEDGLRRKVSESYLVDSLSFTEAEARIIEEMKPFISGEFTVANVGRKRLSELFFNENGDRFYEFKVYYIISDERSGAEKKQATKMMAQASNLKEAIAVLEERMKGSMGDYVIAAVKETAIEDVFPYTVPEEKEPTSEE